MTDIIDLDENTEFPDEPWTDIVKDAKFEFELDGAVAVYTSFKTTNQDFTMTDYRAEQILQNIPSGEYLLRLKFIREKNNEKKH